MSAKFPKEAIALSEGENQGLPAIAMINAAYRNYQYCDEFPWLLELSIAFEGANDMGLPSKEEAEILNQLEDVIEEGLKSVAQVHFIARQTWNGTRSLDYYCDNRDTAEQWLRKFQATPAATRTLNYRIKKELGWESWMPTLAHL
jgi:hypothetical protein